MKALPMIFNTEMVQALMDGRKIQTRRPVKLQPFYSTSFIPSWVFPRNKSDVKAGDSGLLYPNAISKVLALSGYSVGDLIYVRETFCKVDDTEHGEDVWVDYRATPKYSSEHPAGWDCDPDNPYALKWKPSIHMPRELSRITLKVTSVRVERVQDISEADAIAEGFKLPPVEGQGFAIGARTNFRHAWTQIYGDHWDNNGWCWVIDFDVILKNVDTVISETEV